MKLALSVFLAKISINPDKSCRDRWIANKVFRCSTAQLLVGSLDVKDTIY
jgi:hypothetical protein